MFYVPITCESNQVQVLRNTVNVWDHMSRVTSRCLEHFEWSACDSTVLHSATFFFLHGVWEGILEIPRDLTKTQSGMWENVRFVDWVRNLRIQEELDSLKSWQKKTVFGTEMTEVWDTGLT